MPVASASSGQQLRSSIDGDIRPSEVQERMVEVEARLRAGKWKAALKDAQRLTEIVVRRTWYGQELKRTISELALYQAVAEANLDRREIAVWHWHIAQNLDFRMRQRDLAPYGKAGQGAVRVPRCAPSAKCRKASTCPGPCPGSRAWSGRCSRR